MTFQNPIKIIQYLLTWHVMQCPIIMLLACISQWEKRIPKFRTILYVFVSEGTNYYKKIWRRGEKCHKPATQLIHEKSNPCHINEVNRSKKDRRLEEQVKRRVDSLRKVFDYIRSALLKQSITWVESSERQSFQGIVPDLSGKMTQCN